MHLSGQRLYRCAIALVAIISGLLFSAAPSSATEHGVTVTNATDRGVWVTVYRKCSDHGCRPPQDGAYCVSPGKTERSGHNIVLWELLFEVKRGIGCGGANAARLTSYYRHSDAVKKMILFTVEPNGGGYKVTDRGI
jgi:hypothetical protein